MKPWVVIPMKPLATAKSRLAPLLSNQKRQQLVITLFKNTLSVLSNWNQIGGILVVSADKGIQYLAPHVPITFLQEDQERGLNASIELAASKLAAQNVESILVIHADLPFLNQVALNQILEESIKPGICIAPDHNKTGTNVLYVSPPKIIPFSYGENSFHKHLESAREIGLPARCVLSEPLSMDIDLPADLTRILHHDFRVEESFIPIFREIEGIIK
jgi:2-phospho-L-lactate guanylyltransferase